MNKVFAVGTVALGLIGLMVVTLSFFSAAKHGVTQIPPMLLIQILIGFAFTLLLASTGWHQLDKLRNPNQRQLRWSHVVLYVAVGMVIGGVLYIGVSWRPE